MARIGSRAELVSFIKRSLGEPYLRVNVTEEQISDRIDDAFDKFFAYHSYGTEENFLMIPVNDETVEKKYVPLPSNIYEVIKIHQLRSAIRLNSRDALFDVQYRIMYDELVLARGLMANGQLQYLDSVRSYLSLIDEMFNPYPSFSFNYVTHKLHVYDDLERIRDTHGFLVIRCRVTVPLEQEVDTNTASEAATDVWNNEFIKRYSCALVQKQWAKNLMKFNVEMDGGVQINKEAILAEAKEEIEKLELELRNRFQEPPRILIG